MIESFYRNCLTKGIFIVELPSLYEFVGLLQLIILNLLIIAISRNKLITI